MDMPDFPNISDRVRLVWACNYKDGLLAGICEVDGETCWFDVVDWEIKRISDKKVEVRLFQVYRLTPEQRIAETERHLCFTENVGSHFNYINNRRVLPAGNIKPDRFWRRYFSRYPDHADRMGVYDGNEVLGIFFESKLSRKRLIDKPKENDACSPNTDGCCSTSIPEKRSSQPITTSSEMPITPSASDSSASQRAQSTRGSSSSDALSARQ